MMASVAEWNNPGPIGKPTMAYKGLGTLLQLNSN